jgi:hypothetical protein
VRRVWSPQSDSESLETIRSLWWRAWVGIVIRLLGMASAPESGWKHECCPSDGITTASDHSGGIGRHPGCLPGGRGENRYWSGPCPPRLRNEASVINGRR